MSIIKFPGKKAKVDKPEDDIDMIVAKAKELGMEVIGVYDKEEIDTMPLDELPAGLFKEQFVKRNKKD